MKCKDCRYCKMEKGDATGLCVVCDSDRKLPLGYSEVNPEWEGCDLWVSAEAQ